MPLSPWYTSTRYMIWVSVKKLIPSGKSQLGTGKKRPNTNVTYLKLQSRATLHTSPATSQRLRLSSGVAAMTRATAQLKTIEPSSNGTCDGRAQP